MGRESFECRALTETASVGGWGTLSIEASTLVFRSRTAELAIPLASIRSVDPATGGVTVTYADAGAAPRAKRRTATAWFMNFGAGGTSRQCAGAIAKAVSAAASAAPKAGPTASATPLLEDACHFACDPFTGRGTLRRDDGGVSFTGPFEFSATYGAISAVKLIGGTIALSFRKKIRGTESTGAMVTPERRARRWASELREAALHHEGDAMVAKAPVIKK